MTSAVPYSFCRTLYTCKVIRRMLSTKYSYEEAVHKLNNLQSNKSTIEQIRRDMRSGQKCTNLEDMENYLLRTGISLTMLDQLSVIHIAGTKGKGSTSAMCESILRHHGFKTGFYSSPHLVSVCERIRLNGNIISKETFTDHFHHVFNLLDNTKAYEGDMPKYFAFLTVLAYYIFLKEQVDVAVIEVGIGGAVDYTNILRKVPVVGITSLGLDHTSILGNTIEEIAEAKAGIMKPGCEAYTVSQSINAMNVLYKVATGVKCPLYLVPDYKTYLPSDFKKHLPVELEAYYMNASLAIQLAHAWLRVRQASSKLRKQFTNDKRIIYNERKITGRIGRTRELQNGKAGLIKEVPMETMLGLRNCKWPGRYQMLDCGNAQFFLDGAHTKESMEICAKWFSQQNSFKESKLIFSTTGDRDAKVLLKPLAHIKFETVFFVTPTAFKETNEKNDNYSAMEQNELISRCYKNAEIWGEIQNAPSNVVILECVSDALNQVQQNVLPTSVLITGSLHLVGAALSILDNNLYKSLHNSKS